MKDNGGPAFPQHYCDNCNDAFESPNGMTLRDWFAGQALAGLCADPNSNLHSQREICLTSYEMADAMLAERNKA